ncbi:MAG: peptidoglycan-binding LysM-like protein, partial [Hydrogenophilales bacterium 16-62-9]
MRQLVVSLALLLAAPVLADTLKLQDNAPDKYVVVKGDTLWDISARFLKDPWRWPQIWNLNREEVKNPHWIYPGDLIVLDRSGKEPRLALVKGGKNGMPTIKLSPGVRAAEIGRNAIPAIPITAIHAFLKQPLLVSEDQLNNAPQILGTNEERVIMTTGDTAYATSDGSANRNWQIYRQGQALTNPDNGALLGYEAVFLGDAETLVAGNPQKLQIKRVAQEVFAKDKLLPAQETTVFEFVPHAPEKPISGKVISAYGAEGMSNSGRYQTVVINRGAQDGLEPGHVLAVYRTGKLVKMDPKEGGRQRWVFLDSGCIKPGEKIGFDQPYEPGKV